MKRVPAQGEIWHISLDPTKGGERQGARFVFVLSHAAFNKAMGLVLAAPVMQ